MSREREWLDRVERHDAMYVFEHELGGPPGVCIVPTRYNGTYEGGMFAAISVKDLNSEAFWQDCSAADWWHYNLDRVGVGGTPNEAMEDWFQKVGKVLVESWRR